MSSIANCRTIVSIVSICKTIVPNRLLLSNDCLNRLLVSNDALPKQLVLIVAQATIPTWIGDDRSSHTASAVNIGYNRSTYNAIATIALH